MPSRRGRTAELEGYLEGVRRRLIEREGEPEEPTVLGTRWREAHDALGRGDTEAAERTLLSIDAVLDGMRDETEVFQRPRGLVDYTPASGREVAPGPEEEPLENRLRVLSRLSAIRASEGLDVREARRRLTDARSALAREDRSEARRFLDLALDQLERPRRTTTEGRA